MVKLLNSFPADKRLFDVDLRSLNYAVQQDKTGHSPRVTIGITDLEHELSISFSEEELEALQAFFSSLPKGEAKLEVEGFLYHKKSSEYVDKVKSNS